MDYELFFVSLHGKMKTMRYRLLSVVGCLLSVVPLLAQPRFVPDTDIKKVGEVEFQVPRQFALGFTNKGDKPLTIKDLAERYLSPTTPNCWALSTRKWRC